LSKEILTLYWIRLARNFGLLLGKNPAFALENYLKKKWGLRKSLRHLGENRPAAHGLWYYFCLVQGENGDFTELGWWRPNYFFLVLYFRKLI